MKRGKLFPFLFSPFQPSSLASSAFPPPLLHNFSRLYLILEITSGLPFPEFPNALLSCIMREAWILANISLTFAFARSVCARIWTLYNITLGRRSASIILNDRAEQGRASCNISKPKFKKFRRLNWVEFVESNVIGIESRFGLKVRSVQ